MSLRSVPECLHAIINASTGTIPVVAAVANQRVYVYRLIRVIGTPAVTLTLQDTASNPLSGPLALAANGSITLDTNINGDPWWLSGTGLGVQLSQGGGTTAIGGDLWYLQGP
jgi:hypothetical protein